MTALSKRITIPRPLPAKYKTRLNEIRRDKLLLHMIGLYQLRLDDSGFNSAFEAILQATNAILRETYPEADMVVLRKYELTRVDTCLHFARLETQRFFSVQFEYSKELEARLADIPDSRGCSSRSRPLACDADFEALADGWAKAVEYRTQLIARKRSEYRGFLAACRYLEDVEQVVPLSAEIRESLGARNLSLTAVNPSILRSIEADFAQVEARKCP